MFSKRISISTKVRRQPKSDKSHTSATMKSISDSSSLDADHYNDWPNALGFDTTYEEHKPVVLHIEGTIPAYAAGTLFRTGIGPRSVSDNNGKVLFRTNHWFDSFSQVHRFQLHAPTNSTDTNASIDKATYNSRLTCDRLIARIQETGKADDFTFAAKYDPCKSFFQKVQAVFEKAPEYAPNEINNAVTMSINYPGLSSTGTSQPSLHDPARTVTLCNKTDAARIQMLDPETLAPTGIATQSNLHPDLKGVLSAAHPETDPATGDVYNYNMDFTGPKATYHVFRTSAATGETSILATIKYPPAYVHSMFMTSNYLILCIWNCHFTKAGASILWTKNLLDTMYFNKNSPTTWFVVDRRCPRTQGGKGVVAKFESEAFFAFHTINAYEAPSAGAGSDAGDKVDIVCDVATYVNTDVLHYFYMDNLVSSNPKAHQAAQDVRKGRYDDIQTQLRRYILPSVPLPTSSSSFPPLSAMKVSKAILDFTAPSSESPELPTFNPNHTAKPYRYIYGIHGPDGTKSTFVDELVKYDLNTKTAKKWCVKGQTPGEAIFIPKPDGDGEEDDGVLLSVVLDGYTEKSYLLCLDAKEMKEVGRACVDGAVGFGFHGIWTEKL